MNEHKLEQNIKKGVLEKIKSGSIHMRLKSYFTARLFLVIFFTVLALLISVFVISFVFFSINEGGHQFLLGFGSKGISTFFSIFPWMLLVVDIVILILLEWLLQGLKFAYRFSLITIFIVIFLSSTILGIIFNLTPIHGILLDKADKSELPIIGKIYESIHDSHSDIGVFKGTISSIKDNIIIISHNDKDYDADDGTHNVILPENYPSLNLGDKVYVFGSSASNGLIIATGINKLTTNDADVK